MHVVSSTIVGDYVYWTDWQDRTVERVNKWTGQNRTVILDNKSDIMNLVLVDTVHGYQG